MGYPLVLAFVAVLLTPFFKLTLSSLPPHCVHLFLEDDILVVEG
jgi:hypothetical protein